MRIGIAATVATAIVLGSAIIAGQGGGGDPGLAHLWVDLNGGTCARSSSPAAYADAAACSSFDAAYQAAACDDRVLVKAGSYGSQLIVEDATISACSAAEPVVFDEADGEAVDFTDLILGNNNGSGCCYDTNAPDNLEFHDFTYTGDIVMWGDAIGILFQTLSGGAMWIQGAQNISVLDSEFGPCPSTAGVSGFPGECGRMYILDGTDGDADPTQTSDILFENNEIHDFTISCYLGADPPPCDADPDHWETFFITGGNDVTIRGNRIYNCDTYCLNLGDNGASAGYSGTWLIENNWFGNTCCLGGIRSPGSPVGSSRDTAVLLFAVTNTVIRYNSFASGQKIANENPGGTDVVVDAVGNIFGSTGSCADGVTWDFNLWMPSGTTCGTNATGNVGDQYVNGDDAAAMDYHLASGSQEADNYVTSGTGILGLTTDYDGETRPNAADGGTNRDAGADERDSP